MKSDDAVAGSNPTTGLTYVSVFTCCVLQPGEGKESSCNGTITRSWSHTHFATLLRGVVGLLLTFRDILEPISCSETSATNHAAKNPKQRHLNYSMAEV